MNWCGDWETFVDESRGRPYLSETVGKILHPAADFLDQLRKDGVPAKASYPEWMVYLFTNETSLGRFSKLPETKL